MAVGALIRRVFVHHDVLVSHRARLRMTFRAGNIRVAAGQRQVRPGVMVEGGWGPSLRIVALGAASLIILCEELSAVSVVVAGFALLWRAGES